MNQLYAGFSRVVVTPMMGIELYGYYKVREAEGVLDDLEINAVALACGEAKVLLISVDHCGMTRNIIAKFQENISRVTGVPTDAIFISATHVHTGPYLVDRAGITDAGQLSNIINTNPSEEQKKLQQEYYQYFYRKIADAAKFAMDDLKPVSMSWGRSIAPGVGFIRRYRMKDGAVKTNPGVGNPNVVGPIGRPDEEVGVIRFHRENAEDLLLVSYGNHPDVIGGRLITADWPGHTRRTLERAVPGLRCTFFNGIMGDVNHMNINRKEYELAGGYELSRHIGQVVAGGVLQVLDNLKPETDMTLKAMQQVIHVPSNMPDPKDMAEAHMINDLHKAGRDSELPGLGVTDSVAVPKAARMVRLEHGPAVFDMTLSAVTVGKVAILGIPGQLFSCAGFDLKAIAGWDLILPISQTNGAEGYFPPLAGYVEGGYEAVSSNFKAGVSEQIVQELSGMLDRMG